MMKKIKDITLIFVIISIFLIANLLVSGDYVKNDISFIDDTYLNGQYLSNDGSTIFREYRYRYRFTVDNDISSENKYELKVAIDYDFLPLVDMSDEELNKLVEERVKGIENIISNASEEELFTSDGIIDILNEINEFLEYNNNDKIYFMYYISEYLHNYVNGGEFYFPFSEAKGVYLKLYNPAEVAKMVENDSDLKKWCKKYE